MAFRNVAMLVYDDRMCMYSQLCVFRTYARVRIGYGRVRAADANGGAELAILFLARGTSVYVYARSFYLLTRLVAPGSEITTIHHRIPT